jgi:hypothetical protein
VKSVAWLFDPDFEPDDDTDVKTHAPNGRIYSPICFSSQQPGFFWQKAKALCLSCAVLRRGELDQNYIRRSSGRAGLSSRRLVGHGVRQGSASVPGQKTVRKP